MVLPLLVVKRQVLLDGFLDNVIVDDDGAVHGLQGVHHQLDGVDELAGVAAGNPQHRLVFLHTYFDGAFLLKVVRRRGDDFSQLAAFQIFEDIDLTAGQQRRNHLKGGVFGGGADESDDALFHRPEQRVLLRLGEPVDFIDEEDGLALFFPCLFDHVAHVLHAGVDGAEHVEGAVCHLGDEQGERGLAHAGRTPQNHGVQIARLDGMAQGGTFTHQVLLTDIFIDVFRA